MTAPPAGALEACLALLEKATEGEWEVVQGDEWTTDIGTPEGEYEDGRKRHWNVASVNRRRDEWEANRQLIAAAVNLLRTHGPALLAALRLREWRPIESAPKDGSLFLGWVAAERWSAEDGGGSGRSADTSEVDFCQWRNMASGGFYENMMGQIGDSQDITHWMPLPSMPETPTADDLARVLEESATGGEAGSA